MLDALEHLDQLLVLLKRVLATSEPDRSPARTEYQAVLQPSGFTAYVVQWHLETNDRRLMKGHKNLMTYGRSGSLMPPKGVK